MRFRHFVFTIFMAAACWATAQESVDYKPNFHGAIRSRWEMETATGEGRFQVRFARLTIDGQIAPGIEYFAQTDLCDQGKFKVLDAYGRLRIVKGLSFQAGQFRLPFGVEPFMAPQNYIFANRSFMGKTMCNYRKVGAKLVYNIAMANPLALEAGVFNNGAIGDHNEWNKSYSYAGKAVWTLGQFKLAAGAMSVMPETTRLYLYDGAVSWQNERLLIAAEYMAECYSKNAHKSAHSYCAYADYRIPVKVGTFNKWSVQGRFDGITAYWSGLKDSPTMNARNRVTIGSTLTYKYKAVFADIILDYEKYIYHSHVHPEQGAGDKIVAELVVRF